eukprot:gene6472-7137_t
MRAPSPPNTIDFQIRFSHLHLSKVRLQGQPETVEGHQKRMRSGLDFLNMLLPMAVLLSLNLIVQSRSEHLTHELNNVWINRSLHSSSLAKEIHEHQSKCTSKVACYSNQISGMGSNLHVWTQAVCNAMQA